MPVKRLLILSLLLAASLDAIAGQLTLRTGDKLRGDLVRLDGETIIWRSDAFGELTIDKSKVEALNTQTLVKFTGNPGPCAIMQTIAEELLYSCANGDYGRVPLLTLELMEPYEDFNTGTYLFTGHISLTGTFSRGNKEEDDWDLYAWSSLRRGDWRHRLTAEADSDKRVTGTTNKADLSYNLDWFFGERWFWYNKASTGMDDNRSIDSYGNLGSGLGYQFWEREQSALSLEGGLSLINENYDPEAIEEGGEPLDKDGTRTAMRWAVDYRYKFNFGGEFYHRNEWIQSFRNMSDWQIDSDTGFAVPIWGGITMDLKLDYDYDNDPQLGNDKTDATFTFGVGYSW